MRSIFVLLLLLLCYTQSFGQERIISGRLTDETGFPLPQVTILIKGTTIGTATDADGFYSITVPVGATLIFRFLGYGTKEVLVTRDNLQSADARSRVGERKLKRLEPLPSYMFQDSTSLPQPGVAVLNDSSLTHNNSHLITQSLKSIELSPRGYKFRHYNNRYRKRTRVSFSSYLGLEKINQLPSLQQRFAQGRGLRGNLLWQGPEQGEIFSWGPPLSGLEFDGSVYPFDNNGALVSIGAGNGLAAKAYDPTGFFRTGHTLGNELLISVGVPANSSLVFDIEHLSRQGVIPNSDYQKTKLKAKWESLEVLSDLEISASALYNQSRGNLLARGGNLNSIVGSVYRTPASFDNANGFSSGSDVSSSAYRLPNGDLRTHAPGIADNPYGLAAQLPDREENDRFLSSVRLDFDGLYNFNLKLNLGLDLQANRSVFGVAPGYASAQNGRLTKRNNQQLYTNGSFIATFSPYLSGLRLESSFKYFLSHQGQSLERTDGIGFTDSSFGDIMQATELSLTKENLSRTVHELQLGTQFEKWGFVSAGLSNRTYFSNTVDYDQFTNFFPSGSLNLHLEKLLKIYGVNDLSLFASGSRSLKEAPLLYNSWAYESTTIPANAYNQFYESGELFSRSGLAPEIISSFETGIHFEPVYQFNTSFSFFNNRTENLIAPRSVGNSFALNNIGEIRNKGFTASVDYSFNLGPLHWSMGLGWSKFDTKVQEVYGGADHIALSGFESIQSSFALDQSLGTIYGSSYLRNAEGEKVIGQDGFPIKDSDLKMIGNPIPDWILGWSSNLNLEGFSLHFAFDIRKGGDVWNGTQAMLDYLGTSATTGELRNTKGFIFDGVTEAGQPNTTPVDFYDPSQPLSQNRWVRYDWDGIAEAYIEDASWVRLSQLQIERTFFFKDKKIRELKLSLTGHNLILITPYTGVDPAATLFGYAHGSGLDLFNLPSTRSYTFKFTLQF